MPDLWGILLKGVHNNAQVSLNQLNLVPRAFP